MWPSLQQRESKLLLRPRGTNDPHLTPYQSCGITGSGLYPRTDFGTVTIRRDELLSHRADEPLTPWAVTVFFHQINRHSRLPQIHLYFCLSACTSSTPFPSAQYHPSPCTQLPKAQTKTPAPVLHCQHSCLIQRGQNPELEDQARLSLPVALLARMQRSPLPSHGSRQSAREKEFQARHSDLGLAQTARFNF